MLRIVNKEQIRDMLLRIPGLVDLQKLGHAGFVRKVEQWLTELEQLLCKNRIPEAGSVATFRGMLISAQKGFIPDRIEILGKPTSRKIKEATAAYVLRQVNDLVSNAILKDMERLAEAKRISLQLVAIAKTKGLIQVLPVGDDYMEMLKAMWQSLSSDPEISAGTVSMEGLIGLNDALIVLGRTITNDAF